MAPASRRLFLAGLPAGTKTAGPSCIGTSETPEPHFILMYLSSGTRFGSAIRGRAKENQNGTRKLKIEDQAAHGLKRPLVR